MTAPCIVTTMNVALWDEYARHTVPSWLAQAQGFRVRIYWEGGSPPDCLWPAEVVDLDASAPWLAPFKAWCDEDPSRRGILPGGGYNMRWDARRFAHKVAAFGHAARDPGLMTGSSLWWMDADVLMHEPVQREWLEAFLSPGAYMAWLDRDALYPECGVFGVRPGHPAHAGVWDGVLHLYQQRTLTAFEETHDSFLIQQVVERAVREGWCPAPASLSGKTGRRTSHPLVNGPLGAKMDHLKGRRKAAGRSFATDIRTPRGERHWL